MKIGKINTPEANLGSIFHNFVSRGCPKTGGQTLTWNKHQIFEYHVFHNHKFVSIKIRPKIAFSFCTFQLIKFPFFTIIFRIKVDANLYFWNIPLKLGDLFRLNINLRDRWEKRRIKTFFQSFPFFQKSHFVKELARMFSTSVCQTVDDIFFARIKIKACSWNCFIIQMT
jgi:hypothetical protein